MHGKPSAEEMRPHVAAHRVTNDGGGGGGGGRCVLINRGLRFPAPRQRAIAKTTFPARVPPGKARSVREITRPYIAQRRRCDQTPPRRRHPHARALIRSVRFYNLHATLATAHPCASSQRSKSQHIPCALSSKNLNGGTATSSEPMPPIQGQPQCVPKSRQHLRSVG